MRIFKLLVLAVSSALVAPSAAEFIKGASFGGTGGHEFLGPPGTTTKVFEVELRGKDRLISIKYGYIDSDGNSQRLHIGGSDGDAKSLVIDPYLDDPPITHVEWYTTTHEGTTRVSYLKLSTADGSNVEAGTPSGDYGSEDAPVGSRLAGFTGSADKEIDRLDLLWVTI